MQSSTRPADEGTMEWTSWEGHNYVLKGLVDELISFGARPQLKLITLQLWAKYLSKLEVAFTSKTKPLLPKFGFHQTSKDYFIIQDHIKRRQSTLKLMLRSMPSSSELHECTQDDTPILSDERRDLIGIGRFVFLDVDREKIKKELADSRDAKRDIDFRIRLMNATQEECKDSIPTEMAADQHIKFNNRIETAFTKIVDMADSRKKSPVEHARLVSHSSCFDPMFLSKQKVLAILCLGLFFSKDSIQISDLIRWINEDHVSFFNMARLFPEGIRFSYIDMAFVQVKTDLRYKSLQRCAFNIANMMGVEVFPAPDLAALARRFVLELQLPSVLGDYAERLMVHCRVGLCKRMMSYEAVVMAFIIVVLKTLFGLDGRTEHSISEFATKMNGLMDDVEKPHLGSRLFVWDDWVRYIECRKSVIIAEHFFSKHRIEKDLTTAAGPYAHHCTKEQIKTHHVEEKKIIFNPPGQRIIRRRIATDDAVAQLHTWKKIKKGYEFPPSLTPQVSYLDNILHRNKSGTVPNMDILTYDHTATSLEFLVEPNKIKEFAHNRGVHVDIKESPVDLNLEYIPKCQFLALRLPTHCREVFVDIKDEVDSQSKPRVNQWPPVRMTQKTRKRNNDINHNDDEALMKMTKEKRRKKVNMPTGCLNDGSSNTTHDNSDEGEHSSKHVQFKEKTRATSSTQHTTLTLHIPVSAYWVYEIPTTQPDKSFEINVEPDFSHSFRWLLNECTRMLEMRTLDLYRVLRQVEKLCAGDADPTELHLRFRFRNLWREHKNIV